MSKLNRVAQRIFGSGAGLGQIGKFGSLAAGAPATTTDPKQAMALSNWLTGWFGAVIGGASPCIEDMNAFGFATTHQLAYLFQAGVPEWDAETTYFIGSIVNVDGVLYVSKTDDNLNNATSDFANWRMLRIGNETGTGQDFWGSAAPAGYILADGRTIGSATSGATNRAHADTFDLYSLWWSSFTDTELPIYTSAGALSTRGASAIADFTAGKRLSVVDKRGRTSVGKDNMGGTAANRMKSADGLDGTVLGKAGGAQTHTLTVAQMPSHNHGGGSHTHNYDDWSIMAPGGAATGTTYGSNPITRSTAGPNSTVIATQGGDTAHNNTQPSIVCNYIIKL